MLIDDSVIAMFTVLLTCAIPALCAISKQRKKYRFRLKLRNKKTSFIFILKNLSITKKPVKTRLIHNGNYFVVNSVNVPCISRFQHKIVHANEYDNGWQCI